MLIHILGSPLDDEIVMGDDKSCVVKNDGGNNNYVIYLSNEHDFTHTIIDDSESLGQIFLVRRTKKGPELRDVVFDDETQTLVTFMRNGQGKHTYTGRIVIKRNKPGDVKEMNLYLVGTDRILGCKQLPSLDSEGFDCTWDFTLGHASINRGIGSRHRYNFIYDWDIDDRPVPSVPFHYHLDTNVEADPIPGLCGDFIISLGYFRGDRPERGGSRQFSLRLPSNSFLAIDDYLRDDLDDWMAAFVVYYLKSEKKLVYEHRMGYLTEAWYSVEVHVPEAKRIVFRSAGNYRLLLDLKHDDRPAVNLGSEYLGLTSRPVDEYKFTEDFTDESSKPKQVVLGVPAKTPTETTWKIQLGKAKTYAGEKLEGEGRTTTGDYAENALIVSDTLWVHLSREGNDMHIEFRPSKRRENRWTITVKKGSQRIHRVRLDGANTLAYHEGLFRSNLYDLVNGEKKPFDLYDVWRQEMDILHSDIISEANKCR